MAVAPNDDLFHVRRGVAALAACIVQTLNESDPTFQERFVQRLEKAANFSAIGRRMIRPRSSSCWHGRASS